MELIKLIVQNVRGTDVFFEPGCNSRWEVNWWRLHTHWLLSELNSPDTDVKSLLSIWLLIGLPLVCSAEHKAVLYPARRIFTPGTTRIRLMVKDTNHPDNSLPVAVGKKVPDTPNTHLLFTCCC